MDDHDSSSSGLMIGIIVGGAVALVLIAFVIFGGALLFWHREAAGPGGPVMAEAVIVKEEAVGGREPPVAADGEQAPDPTERKLIGVWDSKTPEGDVNTLDFRADHTAEAIAESKGKRVTASLKWHLIRGNGETKLWRLPMQGVVDERPLPFLADDRFQLHQPPPPAPPPPPPPQTPPAPPP